MFYEWDDSKAQLNHEKHGVSFEDVEWFDWTSALVKEDTRLDYGESRYNALGLMNDRLYQITFTVREETIRVISFRKANKREVRQYGYQIKIKDE